MPNQKNQDLLTELKLKVSKAKSIVFADYKGLKSNQANELRKKLAESNAEVEVAKNTLMMLALKEAGHDVSAQQENFKGATAAIISYDDAVSPLKKLYEFIKTATVPVVKLGLLDGKFYSASEVETLSKLPSREQLLAQVLSGFNSPISGFVNVLSGTKRNFVYALNAVAEKKSSESK